MVPVQIVIILDTYVLLAIFIPFVLLAVWIDSKCFRYVIKVTVLVELKGLHVPIAHGILELRIEGLRWNLCFHTAVGSCRNFHFKKCTTRFGYKFSCGFILFIPIQASPFIISRVQCNEEVFPVPRKESIKDYDIHICGNNRGHVPIGIDHEQVGCPAAFSGDTSSRPACTYPLPEFPVSLCSAVTEVELVQ